MNKTDFDIRTLIGYVEREYGLDREVIFQILELSILKAASKNKNLTNDLHVEIGRDDYKVHVYDSFVIDDEETGPGFITSKIARRFNHYNPVNVGDVMEIEIPAEKLGRVCARESRMMILQKIKSARNSNIVNDYRNRIGDIVTGIVSGFDRGNIIFTVNGKIDMVIPRSEKSPREKYKTGDSVSGIIIGINEKQKHSPIVVSRASERYVEELMKREISELDDGTIEIVNIARNPGFRTKVAIRSNNEKVDPVGSCVGRHGMRIKNIMNELHGERLDIIRYSENIEEFIRESLSPAKVDKIEFDNSDMSLVNVTVSPDEYQNAVGKFGKNVNLASRLTNLRLHIVKSLETASFEERKEHAITTISELFDISCEDAKTIVESGYLTAEGIAEDDMVSFSSATGLNEVKAAGIHAAACEIVKHTNGIIDLT